MLCFVALCFALAQSADDHEITEEVGRNLRLPYINDASPPTATTRPPTLDDAIVFLKKDINTPVPQGKIDSIIDRIRRGIFDTEDDECPAEYATKNVIIVRYGLKDGWKSDGEAAKAAAKEAMWIRFLARCEPGFVYLHMPESWPTLHDALQNDANLQDLIKIVDEISALSKQSGKDPEDK